MKHNGRKIVIVGGGIAGLCAAVYALKCGYDVEVLEMNDVAGGLAMSWRRGPYTFETCLHWLIGSKPNGEFHEQWKEVFDIDLLTFVDPHEFVRIETEQGDILRLYTNADMLEAELLRRAPDDLAAIRDLMHMVRSFGKFRMLDPSGGLADNWVNMLRDLPMFPRLAKLGKMSGDCVRSVRPAIAARSLPSSSSIWRLSTRRCMRRKTRSLMCCSGKSR